MKLYYSPAACSLSPHIVLSELGLDYESEKVDLRTKKTASGQDFSAIAEKSAVPLLVLDNGEQLTESAVMVQYLADLKPEAGLIPKAGSFERVRLQEWMNYIATELHKGHFPMFKPEAGAAAIELYTKKLKAAYDYVSGKLEGKTYLMGEQFTVADAYLFTILGWHKFIKLDLNEWPVLADYYRRVASRPAVKEAMKAEGIVIKDAA